MSIFLINPFLVQARQFIERVIFRGGYEAGRTTRAATAFASIKSLSTTEPAGTNYAAFWQIIHDFASATADSRVQLFETSVRQLQNMEPQDTTDAFAGGGMYAYAGGTNKTFQIQVSGETTAVQGYAGYSLNVLQLHSSDKFQNNLAVASTTSQTFTTRVSVTITEPGDYLIIGSCELLTDNADARIFDGTSAYGVLGDGFGQDATNYSPYFHIERRSFTNETLSLQYRSNDGTTMSIRGASIIALKLDRFENSYYAAIDTTFATNSTTFETCFSETFNIVNPGNYHLVLGCAMLDTNSITVSGGCKLSNITRGVDYSITHFRESNALTERYPTIVARVVNFAGSTNEIGWRYISETTGVTTNLSNIGIAILDLGVPAPAINLVGTISDVNVTTIDAPNGLQEGDILFVASHSTSTAQNLPTGFTNGQNGVTNTVQYRWSYKTVGSVPDTTITGLSASGKHIAFAFRDIDTGNILDVAPPAISSGTAGMPNSPSITTVNNDTIVVSIGFLDDDAVQASVTPPVGYVLARAVQATTDPGTLMIAYKVLESVATEDPGAFGGDGTDDWVAATFALRKNV
jgi:hypothetical protein